jgi:hypothetical protein
MSQHSKLATIECGKCSALIEVFPTALREGPDLEWGTLDEDLCQSPPLRRCPYARTEIRRRFPDFDI